ncbi:tetratricopeptide repeat protein [Streptomyces aureoverticillatus]|uniref:tetratricopeptide repeat protein n=1 Tax=Streptomyces aureoverticillatus TaxID=66871 RepID=UPI0013DA8044|nr:tetratricopeptide repeat protein [Streptomyces aureoverticillatus]QIB43790.1 tetratricopeptide repeat protein [Streptomyces aureoverticillatus]
MNDSFALPRRDPSFLGRTELLDDVLPGYLDRADDGVPVVLNGRVGIGKTVMSSELAHRQHSRYADVSWIDVATSGSGQAAERIAACLTTVSGRPGSHLLVLDGVSDPDDVVRYLPRDETKVLITSRADTGIWYRIARVIQVPVLPREESVRLLRTRVHGLTEVDAMRLAGALDDLPLAMENAASWLTSGMTPGQVLEQLKSSASRILSGYRSSDFPGSLAGRLSKATSVLSAGTEDDRRMLHLLHALAVLGPDPFPTRALRGDRWKVRESDAQYLLTIYDLHRRLGGLRDRGLMILQSGAAKIDEISGAIIRDLLVARPEDAAGAFALAEELLVAAMPERAAPERAWGDWALVAPSVLAVDPANIRTGPGRKALLATYDYLVDSGRYREAVDALGNLRTAWAEYFAQHRAEDLVAMSMLARAHFGRGHYEDAERLNLRVYRERERELGPSHPGTLAASASCALDLGAKGHHADACQLARQSWLEQCELIGQESRPAMRTGSYLARLQTPQNPHQAYQLGQRIYRLQREHLGDRHQHTLDTAHHLALCLAALNEFRKALPLLEETLKYRKEILPPGHPDTLWTAAHYYLLSADLGRPVPRSAMQRTCDGLRRAFDRDHHVVRRLMAMVKC